MRRAGPVADKQRGAPRRPATNPASDNDGSTAACCVDGRSLSGAVMSICGLDFGTSNTTCGVIDDGAPVLAALEGVEPTIPSAIFFEANGGVRIGRAAIAAYVDGAGGRLMRSLKSVLGTSLIGETT